MNDRDYNDTDLDAPEKLRMALMQSQVRSLVVPPSVDDTVLRVAREQLGEPALAVPPSGGSGEPRKRGTPNFIEEMLAGISTLLGGRRLAPFTVAVVAMVAAGLMVWQTVHPRAAARAEDLNADGQVDMLDAFALARELQQGRTPRPQLDLNDDGVVDERDVQILAARAVSLETGGHS
jgi:hypothetical protein